MKSPVEVSATQPPQSSAGGADVLVAGLTVAAPTGSSSWLARVFLGASLPEVGIVQEFRSASRQRRDPALSRLSKLKGYNGVESV